MARIKKKRVKFEQIEQVKKQKRSKTAYILILIAAIFLLINGLFTILARDWIVSLMQQYGAVITPSSLMTYSVIWVVLAFLIWTTVKKIEVTQLKSEKWLLLALGVITIIAGRLESGVLILIAAIIYLRQK